MFFHLQSFKISSPNTEASNSHIIDFPEVLYSQFSPECWVWWRWWSSSSSPDLLLLSDLSLLLSPLSEQQIYTSGLSLVVSRRVTTTPSRQRPWQTPLPVYYFKIKQPLLKVRVCNYETTRFCLILKVIWFKAGMLFIRFDAWRIDIYLATWRDDVTRRRFWTVWELSGELEQKPDLITILPPLHPIISIISVTCSNGM